MSRERYVPRPELLFLLSATLLCTAALTILTQPGYWAKPGVVAPAITIDLSFGLPLLGYLLLVRSGRAPAWSLIPLFAIGMGFSRWWIPRAHQDLSSGLRIGLIGGEALLTLYLVVRLGRVAGGYRALRRAGHGPPRAARLALARVLGARLGGVIFTELSVLWYLTRVIEHSPPAGAGSETFTGHRRNAYPALLAVIVFMILLESSIAHLLLGLWSVRVAWVSTALGVYSAIWALADYQAARLDPTAVTDGALVLNVGLRWHATLPWSEIVAIHDREPTCESQRMTMLGAADFWLELREPTRVLGPFGIVRTVSAVGVGVDAPAELRRIIEERMPLPASTR